MNFLIKLTIIGLFYFLSTDKINCELKIGKYADIFHKRFNETSKDIQKPFDTNIKSTAVNTTFWENYVKIATGIATVMIPQPMGLVVGLSSSIFFSLYDAHYEQKNDKLYKLSIKEKYNEEKNYKNQLLKNLNDINYEIADKSRQIIISVEKQISHLSNHIDNIADKIIETLKNEFHSHTLFYDLRKTLTYLESYYKNNIDCLLLNDCLPNERDNMFEDLLVRSSLFRTELATFVTRFIEPSKILQTSANQEYGLYYYLLWEYKQRANKHLDCNVETEQSEIYRLYVHLILALEKSYSMVIAANMIRYRENVDNKTIAEKYLNSAKRMLQISLLDAYKISEETKIIMKQSSTEIRRCDPDKHEKGITYDRFVQLYGEYTGYTYERFFNPENSSWIYTDTTLIPNKNKMNIDLNSSTGLYGFVNDHYISLNENCQVFRNIVDVTHYYDINDHERLYHHFDVLYRDGSTETFGKNDNDDDDNDGDDKKLITHNFKYPFKYGNKFICQGKYCPSPVETCSIETNHDFSIRHISLVSVFADINHVITGIRWKIIDKVLYFEIQQGKIRNGNVIHETVHWKKTEIHEINELQTVAIEKDSAKGFMLEDVYLPSDHFLTGVQFAWSGKNSVDDLVRVRLFGKNFEDTNTLIKILDPLPSNIIRLALDNADASEYSTVNTVLSTPGKNYIHFQQSDMKKDASQSSIPYLDIQPIVSNPPRPLQGIGLYYKGNRGYGGFVGIRGFIVDMNDEVGAPNVKYYIDAIDDILDDLKDPSVFT